jgi:hypothetical protein
MWLHKLLGGQQTDDSEPSSVPPHPASGSTVASHSVHRSLKSPGVRTQARKKATGFDPYNSGAFRKASAWERISKRQ